MRRLPEAAVVQRRCKSLGIRPIATEQPAEPVEEREVGHGCSPDAATGNSRRISLISDFSRNRRRHRLN
jgi:hypothetical protein